jgi:hypothetical protein
MAEDESDTFARTQVSHPISREATFDHHHKIIAIRRNDREEGLGVGFDVLMHQDLPSLVEDAHIHRPGVEVDPTVGLMLFGVELPEVSCAS